MATESAEAGTMPSLPHRRQRLRLPERIPDLRRPWLTLFELLWYPALLLAIVGPIAGTWYRLTSPDENSALMLGSRAGLALSEDDLTRVRFPVGSAARAAGIEPGDDIIAINGAPVARVVPISERGIAMPNDATDSDYAAFSPIIEGSDPVELDLRLRAKDGRERSYRVRTGEQYIEQDARGLGLSPAMLSVVDLLHIITYPFLLFAAWVLHRRKREDLVSSILSLAILLTIASEQPSAAFLSFVLKVPEWLHQRIYDLGNIALLAGILLFPYGRFMAACVMTLIWRLRHTEPGDAHQQIKWALLGFSGYALFLSLALLIDMSKLSVGRFGTQILLEVVGGLSFGLAFLCLNLGLLVALMRYRLYDAEAVISRSANFALITIVLGGVFAGTNEAVKVLVQSFYGPTAGSTPGIFAAAVATVLVNPAQERISAWSERRFQKNLVVLRDDLPECVRDMRETASLSELVDEVLVRIEEGVRTTRIAAIIGDAVVKSRGISLDEVKAWMSSDNAASCAERICESADRVFPLRVPLTPRHGDEARIGYILVGPRPDGSILSKDEQQALVDVAEPVSRAIRNVIKREKREHEVAAQIASNERRIEELEAQLGRAKPKRSA
jgi:hypothetical protein